MEIFVIGEIEAKKEPLTTCDHQFRFVNRKEFRSLLFLPKNIDPFVFRKQGGVDYISYL